MRKRAAWPRVDVFPKGEAAIGTQLVQLGAAVGLLAWNHSALLNVDSGVESGSSAGALTGCGFKPLPMSVHCVTLSSNSSLYSCWPLAALCAMKYAAI